MLRRSPSVSHLQLEKLLPALGACRLLSPLCSQHNRHGLFIFAKKAQQVMTEIRLAASQSAGAQ